MKEFEHIIFMAIADISIEVIKQNTKFDNYIAGCNYIGKMVGRGNSNSVIDLLSKIITHLINIFGLDIGTLINYLHKYFIDKHYENYYQPINEIRKYFGKYIIINK